MPPIEGPGSPAADRERTQLGRLFALIVLVEIATIAALYVFSRHFAQP